MNYEPHLIAANMSYLLMVWFFIFSYLSITKKLNTSLSSITLFFAWCVYSCLLYNDKFDKFNYIQSKELLILIDVITGLIMTMWLKGNISSSFVRALPHWLRYDVLASKYAHILCFAGLCHIVVILSIQSKSPNIFYLWYDELIILSGLLQMWVSKNGMADAIRKLQDSDIGYSSDTHSYNKGSPIQEAAEDRT